jgi:nucleotide-binding universal stress UspA family protein
MSYEVLLPIIGATWVCIGLALSVFMHRRGQMGFGWLVLGVLMGPMAVVFAWDTLRHDGVPAPQVIESGARRGGQIDVLVGVDGSAASSAALDAAVRLFQHGLGRLTLATVIPRGEVAGSGDERTARLELQRHAARIRAQQPATEIPSASRIEPELVVLRGSATDELASAAATGGYDVLVVGNRGAGLAKSVLGSVARTLASGCAVPALVVAPPHPRRDVGPASLGTTSSAAPIRGGSPLDHAPI